MARRPSDAWRRRVEAEAAQLTQGALAPDQMCAAKLWPESLLNSTDAALTGFEDNLRKHTSPSDEDVFDTIKRLILALNQSMPSMAAQATRPTSAKSCATTLTRRSPSLE